MKWFILHSKCFLFYYIESTPTSLKVFQDYFNLYYCLISLSEISKGAKDLHCPFLLFSWVCKA